MKKYCICTTLILCIAAACFGAGFLARRPQIPAETGSCDGPDETGAAPQTQAVVNQQEIEPVVTVDEKEEFYLVSETGYLLVFAQDQSTICLHTHIPITEFPEKEQEKLRAGIWFSSMMEIFHYLESYTS